MLFRSSMVAALLGAASVGSLAGQADLDDLEMAHVAVTASNIDIAYAHLALALSDDPEIRRFAEVMIRDHSAVNDQVAALAERLGVRAKDNPMSRQLLADASRIKDELAGLRGDAFGRRYAQNELAYHRTVNGVVADAFIPNIETPEVREAFEGALRIFRSHERHAERMADAVEAPDGSASATPDVPSTRSIHKES